MELKDFIKLALADITNAIKESQTELSNGAIINPVYGIAENNKTPEIVKIKFDISVASEKHGSGKKEFGTNIKVLSAVIGKDDSINSETASRISFEIPVFFPPVYLGSDGSGNGEDKKGLYSIKS